MRLGYRLQRDLCRAESPGSLSHEKEEEFVKLVLLTALKIVGSGGVREIALKIVETVFGFDDIGSEGLRLSRSILNSHAA